MAQRIQLRRDTAANWANANPTPRLGEFCWDTTNQTFKIGNGTTPYNSLPVFAGGGSGVTLENVRDDLATVLRAGPGVTITPDDAQNTITFSAASRAAVQPVPPLGAVEGDLWVDEDDFRLYVYHVGAVSQWVQIGTPPTTVPVPGTTTTTTTVAGTTTTTTTMGGAPVNRYQVVDTKIYAPNGSVFYPFGVNNAVKHTDYPYVFEQTTDHTDTISGWSPVGWDTSIRQQKYPHHIGAAKAWGMNTIRVNAVPWNTDPGGPTPGGNVVLACDQLKPGIDQLLGAGFVVMLTFHMDVGSNPVWNDTVDQRVQAFFTRALFHWAGNPRLWINPYNEPWSGGGQAVVTAQTQNLYANWIPFLRSRGYLNPIVFDICGNGQSISDVAVGNYDSFMNLDDNMILSWHAYGINTGAGGAGGFPAYDTSVASFVGLAQQAHDRGHCMIIGEFGVGVDGSTSTGSAIGNANGVEWALTNNGAFPLDIGLLAWHGGHDQYSLIEAHPANPGKGAGPFWNYQETSPNGATQAVTHARSAYGQKFWDKGQLFNVASHIVVPPVGGTTTTTTTANPASALMTDNFDRADGSAAPTNFTAVNGTWQVSSNQLRQTANWGIKSTRYNGAINNNQFIEVDVAATAITDYALALVLRWTPVGTPVADNAIMLWWHWGGPVSIRNGASQRALGGPDLFADGTMYRLRAEVVGNTVNGYVNNVLVVTYSSDANIGSVMTGSPALLIDAKDVHSVRWDNLAVGNM